jgi:hypothetical protein
MSYVQLSEISKVSVWTLTDFVFNPAVIFVTLGRGLLSLAFVFVAVPLIYIFATQFYPSLRPPGLPPSKCYVHCKKIVTIFAGMSLTKLS